MTHKYDDPHLSSQDFLREVMHDPAVAIADRVKAAEYLLHYCGDIPKLRRIPIGDQDCTVTIRIDSEVEGTA